MLQSCMSQSKASPLNPLRSDTNDAVICQAKRNGRDMQKDRRKENNKGKMDR